MKKATQSFSQLLEPLGYRHDLRSVFDDFLTLSMCAVTQKGGEGVSHYEDLYLKTVNRYANDELRHHIPKAFGQLVMEMEQRESGSTGNDVLGEFYEQNFSRKHSGQFFTPWPVCEFMAHCTIGEPPTPFKQQHVIDPACGSGRTLLAGAKLLGPGHRFYGIDLDHTCVKMAALNLFLNGVFGSEVMWADALDPNSFHLSYHISRLPLGIFHIDDRKESRLWQRYNASFADMSVAKMVEEQVVDCTVPKGPQLRLF